MDHEYRVSPLVIWAMVLLGLIGVGIFGLKLQATRTKYETARTQCNTIFENAAKQIGTRHNVSLSVGPVRVAPYDTPNGDDSLADLLECSADVSMDHEQYPDRWFAAARVRGAAELRSARLGGVEMVDELLKPN
jgi:hypothetical protein